MRLIKTGNEPWQICLIGLLLCALFTGCSTYVPASIDNLEGTPCETCRGWGYEYACPSCRGRGQIATGTHTYNESYKVQVSGKDTSGSYDDRWETRYRPVTKTSYDTCSKCNGWGNILDDDRLAENRCRVCRGSGNLLKTRWFSKTPRTHQPQPDPEHFGNRASCLYSAKHYDEALELINAYIADDPSYFGYRLRGLIYKQQGEYEKATDDFYHEISRLKDPDVKFARYVFLKAQDYPKAVELCQRYPTNDSQKSFANRLAKLGRHELITDRKALDAWGKCWERSSGFEREFVYLYDQAKIIFSEEFENKRLEINNTKK